MSLTLVQKFDALHAAEAASRAAAAASRAADDAMKKAYADLIDSSTGEAIKEGDPPTIDSKGRSYWIANGKLHNGKPIYVGGTPAS